MTLINVLDTIQLFMPYDPGGADAVSVCEQRDLCGDISRDMGVGSCPIKAIGCCQVCPFNRDAYLAEEICMAVTP